MKSTAFRCEKYQQQQSDKSCSNMNGEGNVGSATIILKNQQPKVKKIENVLVDRIYSRADNNQIWYKVVRNHKKQINILLVFLFSQMRDDETTESWDNIAVKRNMSRQ